jgi:hypothetical protein
MTVGETISALLRGIQTDIIAEMLAKEMNASGKTIKSLTIKSDDKGGELAGLRSFFTLVGDRDDGGAGRRPGKMPPVTAIRDWIIDKGIEPGAGQTLQGLAFVIARSIGARGNRVFRSPSSGLQLRPIFERHLATFQTNLGEVEVKMLADKVEANLKRSYEQSQLN